MKQKLLRFRPYFLLSLVYLIASTICTSVTAAPLPLDVVVELKKDVSCYGEEDGAVTFVVAGLSTLVKYSYKLKDSEDNVIKEGDEGLLDDLIGDLLDLNTGLTLRFEDLAAGDYTFELTSRPLGVLPQTTISKSFTIEQPDKLKIIDLNIIDIDCINPTGSIEVITSGGIGNIDLGFLNLGVINLGGEGNTIIDLTEGVYDILVKDENGCEADTSATVGNLIEIPEIDITGDLDLGCHDFIDLNISSSNGVTLSVDTPDGEILGGLLGNTFKVSTPGIYIATALDPLTGCVSSDTVEVVAEVNIPELDLGTDRILGCLDVLELDAVTNATSVLWENISGTVLGNGKVLEVSAPGTYVAVALNDITGCENRDTIIVTPGDESDNATIEFEAGADVNLGCLEVLDLIVINNDGLSINWETIGGSILQEPVDNVLSVTKPGVYVVSAVDLVTGCLISDTITVNAEINIGTVDIAQDTLTLDCDGNAVITANNNDLGANVKLLWETIEGDLLIDEEGTSVTVDAPGTYAIVATDIITSCSTSDTVVVVGSDPLVLDAEVNHISCGEDSNGKIILEVTGGIDPYTYEWSNGATTSTISGLSSGNYSVIVKDARGCQVSGNWTVKKLESPSINITLNKVGENRVQATAQVTGGNPPYQYLWSTGSTESTEVFSPGQYTLTVTDASGCVASELFTIIEDFNEEDPEDSTQNCNIDLNLTVLPSTEGETWDVQVTAEGGTEPYSYEWSNGDSTAIVLGLEAGKYSVTVTDSNACNATSSFTLSDISDSTGIVCQDDILVDTCNTAVYFDYPIVNSGLDYTITQTSGLCSGSVFPLGSTDVSFLVIFEDGSTQFCSFDVIVNPGSPVAELTLPSCHGEEDGKIKLTSNDIDDYYLFWEEKDDQMGVEISGLKSGTYHVRGANKAGCIINEWIDLGEPDSLLLVDAVVMGSMENEDNGQIMITVQGGTYPYTYQWTGPDGFMSDQEDLYQVGPGNYVLTVMDSNGCSIGEKSFDIEADAVSTGLKDKPSSGLIKATVYPNPSNGRLNLNVDLINEKDLNVTIFSQNGKSVLQRDYNDLQDSTVQLDVSGLVSGVYFVRMSTKNTVITRKLTVF